MKVSVIIPCKKRLIHLKQCLPLILTQTYEDLEIIVVDYNCPEGTWNWVWKESGIDDHRIACYRADVKADEWSLSAARNYGFRKSSGGILLFLDADTLLQPTFIEEALKQLNEGTFLTGLIDPPYNGCGCMLVNRKDFEKVRGYNEALKTWGFEDHDMYNRLSFLQRKEFDPALIENIPHPHEIRNEFHGNRNIWETCEENFQISKEKFESSI